MSRPDTIFMPPLPRLLLNRAPTRIGVTPIKHEKTAPLRTPSPPCPSWSNRAPEQTAARPLSAPPIGGTPIKRNKTTPAHTPPRQVNHDTHKGTRPEKRREGKKGEKKVKT